MLSGGKGAKNPTKSVKQLINSTVAKNLNLNNFLQVWPYPCPRPTFKCCWLYRTACLESLQAVALQLRILWACLKWDDMHTKPATLDGKNQVMARLFHSRLFINDVTQDWKFFNPSPSITLNCQSVNPKIPC